MITVGCRGNDSPRTSPVVIVPNVGVQLGGSLGGALACDGTRKRIATPPLPPGGPPAGGPAGGPDDGSGGEVAEGGSS
eukprot:7277338-Prymnesium_polylepis.1